MARVCEVCGKRRQVGMNVSHSHNRTKKIWQPNLQKIRIITDNGTHTHVRVCTSCVTKGTLRKAVS